MIHNAFFVQDALRITFYNETNPQTTSKTFEMHKNRNLKRKVNIVFIFCEAWEDDLPCNDDAFHGRKWPDEIASESTAYG